MHNCLVMHTDLLFDFEHLPYEINFFNFHQDSKILLDGIDYHLLMAGPGKLSFLA